MTTITVTQVAGVEGAPVACTLSGNEYETRIRDLSDLAREALRSREPIPGGERLSFTDTAAVERELTAAIAAEASCCSLLTMRLDRRDGTLVLDVTGPPAAAAIIAELFACAPRRC